MIFHRLLFVSSVLMLYASVLASSPVDYIDTRVGSAPAESVSSGIFGKKTEVLGQTIPAVLTPYGMNFWTPQTRDTELKCIAPYYYTDSLFQGFRNSHWIIGGCTQDYGSMTIMPVGPQLRCSPQLRASRYSHDAEVATPYFYQIDLPDDNVTAQLTATSRCAIMRFDFHDSDQAYVVVNPNNDEAQGFVAVDTARNMIYGYNPVYRIYQGKGQSAGFSGHFIVVFDHKIKAFGCYQHNTPMPGVSSIARDNDIGCYVSFDVSDGKPVICKAASSFTSHEGALANLSAELPGWNFDAVKDNLREAWERHLSAIEVVSDNADDLAKFYGAMYRCSFLPHEVNDVDGSYSPFATGYPVVRLPEGETRYFDDYSMWDTYRALHPLLNLLYPSLSGEMMQSLVHKYEQGGWLPIFSCWGSYTSAMIGDHCIAALADAAVKGVQFDVDKAYKAMRHNAFDMPLPQEYLDGKGRRALASYLQYGYIPLEDTVPNAYHKQEQVSRTLEYAYDDYALAQVARMLGKDADYNALMARASNYTNVINPATGYADGRYADGRWALDDPLLFSKHITEGAPCHYTWYVPHDPAGLMKVMGGKDAYAAKLDSMFSQGRYWHGNEPCHQVAFMFNYAGQPWKTSKAVRDILDTEYFNSPGGLSGNEDAGQMSAWYVFAALGFYPVCPVSGEYMISAPTFRLATINLENGNKIVLKAPKVSAENIYIQSVTHNGKPYNHNYLLHSDLMQGGEWVFDMGSKPGKRWGTDLRK